MKTIDDAVVKSYLLKRKTMRALFRRMTRKERLKLLVELQGSLANDDRKEK